MTLIPIIAALLVLAPQPAYADVSSGGTAIGIAQSALDATLVVTASALFVACAVTIVQRFMSTSDQIASDGGYTYKRISGAFAIMFTIVLLAKGGTSIADAFAKSGQVSWYGSGNELVMTHRTEGQSLGEWSDGESQTFTQLKKSADLNLQNKADQAEQAKQEEQQAAQSMWGVVVSWFVSGAGDRTGANYE